MYLLFKDLKVTLMTVLTLLVRNMPKPSKLIRWEYESKQYTIEVKQYTIEVWLFW